MECIATLTPNPTVDLSATIEQVVADRKLRCSAPRREPGGGGINVSRAIRRLGGESVALYPAGGPIGAILEDLLDAEELGHRSLSIDEWTRENVMIRELSTGRQFRFGMPGPELAAGEWRSCLDAVGELDPVPEWIVASGSLPRGVPEDFFARLARRGRQLGARVLVDTSGEPLRRTLEEPVYLLKPNLRELGDLVGRPAGEDPTWPEVAARELVDGGRATVVLVSLGAAGALLVTGEGGRHLPSPTVPIASRVGAGDSTVAGLVVGLARGWPLERAARLGIAAGAAAVMTPGTELCRREDAERLFRQMEARVERP